MRSDDNRNEANIGIGFCGKETRVHHHHLFAKNTYNTQRARRTNSIGQVRQG